jgi:predicted ATP-grasp superfamily ATP-dependent carboligase
MSRATILIGFAEALSAPEVAWSLVDEGFNVVAFARKGRASAMRYSRHVVCHEICAPESDVQTAISDLHSLMVSLSAQTDGRQWILLPLDDKALYLCNGVPLEDFWLLAGPRGARADLALKKHLQVEAARNAGFNVPKTVLARTAKDIFDFVAAESFPIILKAAECVPTYQGRVHAGRNWICANLDELNRAVAQWDERAPLLAQPFIAGIGEGIFGLATPDGVRAWSAHRRLRMMNPEGSGSSACISQPVSEDLKAKAATLISAAEWHGLFMIELLRDQAGIRWFVELNGRPWGSMALSRRQGLEYPAWHVKLAMDQRSGVGVTFPLTPGVVCRNVGRELIHVLFVLRGAKSSALGDQTSLWQTLRDVFRIRRGDTLYNWRRDDPKVFLADCYYTIHDNLFKARN